MTDTELWKPVIGYESIYEISNHGGLKRIAPWGDGRKRTTGLLKPQRKGNGYLRFILTAKGTRREFMAHRLVLAAFVGPLPPTHEVNHKNGIKTDNRLENLEYISHSANQLHAYKNLLIPTRPGSKHHAAKVSENDVFAMRALRRRGWQLKRLSKEFGLSVPTICWICLNKAWRHI